MTASSASTSLTDKRQWWTTRRQLDKQLKVTQSDNIHDLCFACMCKQVSVLMWLLCTCMY